MFAAIRRASSFVSNLARSGASQSDCAKPPQMLTEPRLGRQPIHDRRGAGAHNAKMVGGC
jgi:hypothetical protein